MRWALLLAGLLAASGCIQVDVGGVDAGTGAPRSDSGASGAPTTSRAAAPPGSLQLAFTSDPAEPKPGQVVLFELRVSGLASGDRIASTRWSFGDGQTSGERHPAHTYMGNGTYVVHVEARSARGATGTHSAALRVDANATTPFGQGAGHATGENETREPRPFEPTEPSGTCGSLGSLEPVAPNPLLAGGLATGWPLLELDLALIADPAFVAAHPTDWQELLRDLVADASVHYEDQLGLRLNASLIDRLPDGSLAPGSGDGRQRAVARGYMHANHPGADVDAVAVILGANYEGSVAGQVECVHGAAYPDYSYLWAEYDEDRVASPPAVGLFEDIPLKILMHELAHLLAAHHHYSTCGHPYAEARTSDALGVCDVMINDVGLASFYFGPTNRLVMRSFVEEIGIGEPV